MSVIIISALWCNSCLYMRKILKAFEANHLELTFIHYDLDLDEEVEAYNVKKVLPVIIFEKDKKELLRLEGECDLAQLERGLLDASQI